MSETIPDRGLQATRRAFLVGGAFALTAATAFWAVPRRSEHRLAKEKLSNLVPSKIGPWEFTTMAGVVLPSQEGPVDGYDQVLTRVYSAPGFPDIMLLIAYGSTQGGSLQLHRPETCYPGQGFKLANFSEISLHPLEGLGVAARVFTATRDERVERLLYWTRIADTFPKNTAQEYEAIMGSVIKGVVPDGILVRVSTIGADVTQSDAAIKTFADALINDAPAARPILIGNVMSAAIGQMAAAHT